MVVTLDPFTPQEGMLEFSPSGEEAMEVVDLMGEEARYRWGPGLRYIRLDPTDPARLPFHVFRRVL